ncbi:MAG: isocitrate/isopropylmalate dehydrogenase family protein [Gammaproteobacteria bacterium]|nr:isocitrate/isopropylmalate dehydrogenase family protein [Gammaproteobacteria bacterium]
MRIVVMPGDGIGPEITRATCAALVALDGKLGLGLELDEQPMGLATLETEGSSLPPRVLEAARAAPGVILAPVHTYAYPPAAAGGINPSAAIRIALDLYANIRPSRTRTGVSSPAKEMDLVVVRENTEGFYADRNMAVGSGEFQPTEDVALAVRKITAPACRRIARAAFEQAARRRGKVTMVHKANVLKISDGLFKREVEAVAKDYPGIALDEMLVDAMAARLVRAPDDFDVVVTTNMYGDILSDEAAELAGGLGLAPALNAGDEHAIAQAVHGSAPDIAGQGVANPTALMLSAAMLLDWLGARHGRDDLARGAALLMRAVDDALADAKNHTRDLGGNAGTDGFAAAVVAAIGA